MAKVNPNRVFEDYDPPSDLVTEEACDTLLIYLPGFKKEQLKVQLTISRMLKITGERPLGDNKYRRFHKEFRIPSNCDTKEISAKFEGGILYIRQPKIITPAAPPPPPPPPPAAVQPPKLPAEAPHTQQPSPPPPQASASLPPPPPPPQQQQQQSPQRAPPSPPMSPSPPPSPPKPQPHFQETYPEEGRQEEPRPEDMGNKEEERRDESGVVEGPRQAIGTLGSGLFRELNKPDNLKRLGVSVLLVLIIAFYISYMFKSFIGNEQDVVPEYYEEL